MKKPCHYLVVGSGNIGRRHLTNLKALFPEAVIGCLSASGRSLAQEEALRADLVYQNFSELSEEALKFAVIASPATYHLEHAATLLKKKIPVLIEKPLTHSSLQYHKEAAVFEANAHQIDVAYPFRYSPAALKMKALLEEKCLGKLHSVFIEVGQFLPDWRPQGDYRKQVSANKALGGGVLLELSHELDYLLWLFGGFDQIFCLHQQSGSLALDVEDTAAAIFTRKDGLLVHLHMDFLQRKPARSCKVVGEKGSLEWNLLSNRIVHFNSKAKAEVLFDAPYYDRNQLYLSLLKRFSEVAQGKLMPLVGLQQGLEIVRLIEAMKHSSKLKRMVALEEALA